MAGRPRNFSEPELLENAAKLFQENGYDGVSVPDLVKRLNISRQSLYSIYGDKRGLFLAALDDYVKREMDPVGRELEQGDDPLGAIDTVIDSWLKKADNGVACMVTRNIGEEFDGEVRRVFAKYIARLSEALNTGFLRAQELGYLKKTADVQALAGAAMMVGQGVSAVCMIPDNAAHIRNAARGVRSMIDAERTAKGRGKAAPS